MFFFRPQKKRIYLDNAAATPVHPKVKQAMLPFLGESFGNPSAIHKEGLLAKRAVEEARQKIASVLGIKKEGVIFTSGGTESNNLALLGLVKSLHRRSGIEYTDMEIVTTKIEHPSISALFPVLNATGVKIRFVEVDQQGKITLPALEAALSPKTILVTFAYANSEVGVIQPVSKLVRRIRQYEKETGADILVHLDAAQAPLWLPCELGRLGVDLMSLDAGKCQGPKGVGVLAMRRVIKLLPILKGGGQEYSLRPGTENVAGIVGIAKALEIAQGDYQKRAEAVGLIRDEFINQLSKFIPTTIINGSLKDERLANNINISLLGFDTEFAVVYLDSKGIAASTKSACAEAGSSESKVVLAMTKDPQRANSTIRFTLSEETSKLDMLKVIEVLTDYQKMMEPFVNKIK